MDVEARGRVRVLQLIETLRVGGAETSVLAIASATPGVETVVLPLWGPVEVAAGAGSVEVLAPLDPRGVAGVPALVARLKRRVDVGDIDVVHSTLFYANLVARLALADAQTPLVTTVVGDSYGGLRKRGMTLSRLAKLAFVQLVDGITARRSDHTIFISNALRASHTGALGLDPGRCSVIYRGRPLERFARANSPTERPGAPRILCVGRLVESKRTKAAVVALEILRRQLPSATLTIVGDGPQRAALETLGQTLGVTDAVVFLGTRHDVPAIMAGSDIFVFPSAHEGQGGALVEAMAAGLPIVASNIPAIAESVRDGESAILVGVDDAEAIARACLAIWAQPDRGAEMGARARSEAVARFDVKKVGAAHADVYQRVILAKKVRGRAR
jgi:glycosyltransferase involved in cell wall biosynthesis